MLFVVKETCKAKLILQIRILFDSQRLGLDPGDSNSLPWIWTVISCSFDLEYT